MYLDPSGKVTAPILEKKIRHKIGNRRSIFFSYHDEAEIASATGREQMH